MNKFNLLIIITLLFSVLCKNFADENEFSALILEQEKIQQLMIKLDEKFIRLSESLKEKEPENAKLLIAAFKKSKETLVSLKIDSSMKHLKEKDLEKAIDAQQKVIDDLFQVLNALTSLDFSNKDEIKRLEDLKKQVNQLIKVETQLKNESLKLEDKQAAADKLEAEIAKLNSLIKDSEETLRATVEGRAKGIDHLSGIARKLEMQNKETKRIFESISGYPLEANKSNEKNEVIKEENKPKENQEKEPGAEQLKSASQQFQSAEKKSVEGKPFESEEKQKEAIKSLKKSLDELQKEKNRILSLPENYSEELAQKQNKALDDLQKIRAGKDGKSQAESPAKPENENGENKGDKPSEDNSKDGSDGKKGEQGQNQGEQGKSDNSEKGGDSEKDGPKSAKNQSPSEKADKYMREAEKDLRENKIGKAKVEQQKSIEELKKIREEIEKSLEQLRKEEKEEKLAGLENRFIEILQRERLLQEQNIQLDGIKVKNTWSRTESIKCANLTQEQLALKELVVRAEDILMEDATSIAFPDIINGLKEDMLAIVELLKVEDTGKITQAMISEVIQSLEEIVESLQKAKEEAKKEKEDGEQNGNQGNNKNRLISESAELKLLRKLQLRVNRMSKLAIESDKNANLPETKKNLKRIYDRQKQVLEITRKINERNQ